MLPPKPPGPALLSPAAAGILFGLVAAAIWGGYLGLARAGMVSGLHAVDFVLLRFIPGGLIAIPILAQRGFRHLGGVGWGHGFWLALGAGPLFMLMGAGGYAYAPLAHGAVLQPGSMTLTSLCIAIVWFGGRMTPVRLLGIGLIVVGLGLVAGSGILEGGSMTWLGDLLFVGAGLSWAGYTVLLRRWSVEALRGTAAVTLLSALVAVVLGLAFGSFPRLWHLPLAMLLTQIVAQGVLAGFVAVIFYAQSVALLGSARATLFPAIVPAIAVIAGIPITGEWPTGLQWLGVTVVTAGLGLAVGILGRRSKN